MIEENIKDFMGKVEIKNKEIAIYTNDEKGLTYPLGTPSLLCRVDYLELTKQELDKAKFDQQIDKKEYQMYDCVKVVPKYEITKIESDKFKLTDKKVKATHIYNVKNQLGIHTTLEDKEEAFKLCKEINERIISFFKIIVPNYNNEQWLDKCLSSILRQSFKDYKVVVIDDMSTDSSVDIIKKYPFELVELDKKRYNGGARNVGIDYPIESKYTLFLDSDDWFYTNDVLKKLYFFLKEKPVDCVSLPYHIVYPSFEEDFPLLRNTIRDLVFDPCGACWTKCIKSNLVRRFPENTLMEDTVQHIDQCNYLQTLDSVPFSVVCYNRTNINALTSLDGKKSIKWQVSVLRYLADLMELWCPNADCEERRQERIEVTKKQIIEGRYFKW